VNWWEAMGGWVLGGEWPQRSTWNMVQTDWLEEADGEG
jgi:hypothetical protein